MKTDKIMKTENIKHTETAKLQQNIIITILLQTIGKTTTTIAETKENELLKLLKDILIVANTSIKEQSTVYRDLTPKEANKEIEMLDNMYKLLSTIFEMLFSQLNENQLLTIKPEYNKLIDLMENIREGLELYTDLEFMQIMDDIAKGDLSDFVKVA